MLECELRGNGDCRTSGRIRRLDVYDAQINGSRERSGNVELPMVCSFSDDISDDPTRREVEFTNGLALGVELVSMVPYKCVWQR
jgi:hypothetical protein